MTGPWTEYHYDVKGQLTSVDQVNADGVFATTSLTYDFGGRKLSMDDADMGLWTYAYDTLGNLVQQTDARGQVITMCYDTLNRLTGKAYNASTCASPEISCTYGTTLGELGYRVGMSDLSGSTSWTYNQRGQVTAESKTITGIGTFTTQWAYNSAGMLTQMTYPGGNAGQAGETVYYGYNGQGAIESVASLSSTYLTQADYDAQGRLTEQVFSGEQLIKQYQYYPWAGGSAGSGGKLAQVLAGARSSLTLQNLGYTYDQNGNILTITDNMQTSTFTYDELDRLTSAQAVGGGLGEYPLETYQYDSLGRLWHKAGLEMQYEDPAHIHAVTSTSTGSNFVYDPAGNMTTRDGQTLTYTPEGKVASVTIGTRTTGYGFDGDGNRVRKSEPAEPRYPFYDLVWKRTITIGNYYEFSVVEGLDTYDEITGINYYYAASQRIAMKSNILGIEPAEVTFLLGDHLGSTSLVVDANGTLMTEQRYKPFGESRYRATSGFPTDFQFTGQRYEASTGLYDYVARMYDPVTGHFISADTVFDSFDRYSYVKNNPVNYSDPSGHSLIDDIIFGVAWAVAQVIIKSDDTLSQMQRDVVGGKLVTDHQEIITKEAEEAGISSDLVGAVIRHESAALERMIWGSDGNADLFEAAQASCSISDACRTTVFSTFQDFLGGDYVDAPNQSSIGIGQLPISQAMLTNPDATPEQIIGELLNPETAIGYVADYLGYLKDNLMEQPGFSDLTEYEQNMVILNGYNESLVGILGRRQRNESWMDIISANTYKDDVWIPYKEWKEKNK